MPDLKRLPLVGAANATRSTAYGDQTSINLYGELGDDPQDKAKGLGALYGCPGRRALADAGGRVYALWSNYNRLFAVVAQGSGRDFVEFNPSTGAEISRHNFTATDDLLPAQIVSNANQLLVCSNGLLYCDSGSGPVPVYTNTTYGTVNTSGTTVTLVSITAGVLSGFSSLAGETVVINGVSYVVDTVTSSTVMELTGSAGVHSGVSFAYFGDPMTALTIAYLDGYGIAQRPSGGTPDLGRQINISSLLDFRFWSDSDFTSAEAEPSYIVQIWADNEQLYVLKQASIQVFQNNPNAGVGGFPLANIEGAMAKFGSISRYGAVSLAGKVYFLGFPGGPGNAGTGWISAYVLDGFTPRRVSGKAQESHWNTAGLGKNCISYAYTEDGHDFWCIDFGTECWCFDSSTGAWHQRQGWNGSAFIPYYTSFHAFVYESTGTTNGSHFVAGTSSIIYRSSVNFYDDNGSDMAWQRTIPYVYQGGNLTYYGRMYLECETGTVPSGAAPTITRTYSDDRGATFVGSETESLGTHGQADTRVIWPMAGFSNSMGRIFRFSGAGQYKVALIDLQADISFGAT